MNSKTPFLLSRRIDDSPVNKKLALAWRHL